MSSPAHIQNLNQLLPMVAIGTIADCQSILEPTNRLLVKTGIKMLSDNQHHTPGLEKIMELLGLREKIQQGRQLSSQDLAFYLAPILNSAGRISHASLSIQTLLATSQKAPKLAQKLIKTNENRKHMVHQILHEVETQAHTQVQSQQPVIWLQGNWHKGIIGLLASRLVNQHQLPVIVIEDDGQSAELSASLRAPEGYHLAQSLSQCAPGLLTKFGGHPGAAGFTCKRTNLPQLKTELLQKLQAQGDNLHQHKQPVTTPATHQQILQINEPELTQMLFRREAIWLDAQELQPQLYHKLMHMEPFGQDFPFPRLVTHIHYFAFRWLGQEYKHLRLILPHNQHINFFHIPDQIKHTFHQESPSLQERSFEVWSVLRLTQNTWRGQTNFELIGEKIWIV